MWLDLLQLRNELVTRVYIVCMYDVLAMAPLNNIIIIILLHCCLTSTEFFVYRTVLSGSKSTLAGNCHSSTLLGFLHIDITIRHQIAGVKQAANHLYRSLLQLWFCLAQSNGLLLCTL